jgi:hypothetical protein
MNPKAKKPATKLTEDLTKTDANFYSPPVLNSYTTPTSYNNHLIPPTQSHH